MQLLFKTVFLALVSCMVYANASAAELAPQFTLKSLDGKTVKLSDYKGQVVMVNFWASWCSPCREEMPLLEQIHKKYKKAGFTILGVTIDENVKDAAKFIKKSPVSFPILLDTTSEVAERYKNQAMPSSYFIDRKGNIAHVHRGYKAGEEADYKRVIKKLIMM